VERTLDLPGGSSNVQYFWRDPLTEERAELLEEYSEEIRFLVIHVQEDSRFMFMVFAGGLVSNVWLTPRASHR